MSQGWDEFGVFIKAADLFGRERESFLRTHCPGDREYNHLQRLLADSDGMPPGFLDLPPSVASDDPGTFPAFIDQYEVHAVIGKGAMGIVYRGFDPGLQRAVAIKVLARGYEFHPEYTLGDEARSLAASRNNGIVEVYRLGEFEGRQYIVTEYVSGGTLRDWLAHRHAATGRGGLSRKGLREVVGLIADVALAVDSVHNAGIIHRDIKPSNILIKGERTPLLSDFGVATALKLPTSAQGADPTPAVPEILPEWRAGTLPYIAPECMRGGPAAPPSDVYSLGVLLYEAVSGGPLPNDDQRQPLSERCREASRKLDRVCRRALEHDSLLRYPTAGQMALDLRACLSNEPLPSEPVLFRRTRVMLRRRRYEIAAAAAFALVVSGAGIAGFETYRHRQRLCRLEVATSPAGLAVSVHPIALLRDLPVKGAPATIPPSPPFPPSSALSSLTRANARPAEPVPASGVLVEPGYYRIVASSPDGRFADGTVLLASAGRSRRVELSLPSWSEPPADEMVLIPAGQYELGVEGAAAPRHRRPVELDAFYIDRAEVSNAEFLEFVLQNEGAELPPHLTRELIENDPELAARPITGVTWDEANAYARWRGKRLPSADEWECAMSRPDGRLQPWLGEPPQEFRLASLDDRERIDTYLSDWKLGFEEYRKGTVPVRSAPELSTPLGLYHPATNVAEYTSTVRLESLQVVVKGASWFRSPRYLDFSFMQTRPLLSGDPPKPARSLATGFRCARSTRP